MANLERLNIAIDAFGGDPSRWPDGEREALKAIVKHHPELKARLREERALDRVLAQAPAVPAEQLDRLRERIMGAIAAEARAYDDRAGATVVPLPMRARSPRPILRQSWPAAAALAASLLIGVWLGSSEFSQPAVESLVASAGLDVAATGDADVFDVMDEELL
ncbi:MAG: hypothetical protein R3D57_06070 [Hyphomicrobiaceae bacterium]|jgi:predicted phage tail protein